MTTAAGMGGVESELSSSDQSWGGLILGVLKS